MPTAWEIVGPNVTRLITRITKEHHPDIVESNLTIKALFAVPDEDEGPPLRINDYPQAAIIKKTSARDRVAGKCDVELFLDKRQWDELSAPSQEALIDHELEHVAILRHSAKKGGGIKNDIAGRPKVALKNHDWQIGGFKSIAERHGEAAIEVQNARAFNDRFGQYVFGFAMTST